MPDTSFDTSSLSFETQGYNHAFKAVLKEMVDKIGSIAGLLLFSPIFLFLILKIRQDGGPVFYAQERLGKHGKLFKCWKFRSMVINADERLRLLLENDPEARLEWESTYKLKNDPRVTKIGAFIRRTSLDELPQFYNVLRGDMSLVGPRPIVEDEKKYYGDRIRDYLSVKPGVTGLWQISGRSDTSYEERVALDSYYARHWSLWGDFVIIFKTVFVVLARRGAY